MHAYARRVWAGMAGVEPALGTFTADDDMDALIAHFHDMVKQFVSPQPGLLPTNYGHWPFRLFCGLEAAPSYHEFPRLRQEAPLLKQKREEYKREFLGTDSSRELYMPHGVRWEVRADVELPFIVPVELMWFNPDARAATASERHKNGRLEAANAVLHARYARLLQHMLAIEPYVLGGDLLSEWNAPGLRWHKPRYSVLLRHMPAVGWAMFLAVERSEGVPKGAVISFFAGEVRAHNPHANDSYAFTYIQSKKAHESYLVCTPGTGLGVCSMAFFSNHTCLQEPWFIAVNNRLLPFKKQPDGTYAQCHSMGGRSAHTVVTGSSELYRHRTLITACDITPQMLREDPRVTADAECFYVPVEWNYYNEVVAAEGETRRCACLSRCSFSPDPSPYPFHKS